MHILFKKFLKGIKMIDLMSSHGHMQVTTYREIISGNNLKISRENFPQLKIWRRNHKVSRRTGNSLVRTYSSRTVPHSWKISQLHRSSPKRARSGPSVRLLSQGACAGKKRTQQVWLWKPTRLTFKRSEAARNRPCHPRTHTKSLMFSVAVQSQ